MKRLNPTLFALAALLFIAALALGGCTTPETAGNRGVTAASGEMRRMVASWYGPGFHGRRTASGARFNQHGLTAAHKTARFGTRWHVTGPGGSACVTINDRGPFIRGRDLDLSHGAARATGILARGVGPVSVRRC